MRSTAKQNASNRRSSCSTKTTASISTFSNATTKRSRTISTASRLLTSSSKTGWHTVTAVMQLQLSNSLAHSPDATDFFCSALPAHTARPIPHHLPSSVGQPFSATHFSGHSFRPIPASGSFAASAFPVPPLHHWVPSHKAAARFGSRSLRFWVPQKNGAEKGDIFMSYLNSVTIVGFVGADPEQLPD